MTSQDQPTQTQTIPTDGELSTAGGEPTAVAAPSTQSSSSEAGLPASTPAPSESAVATETGVPSRDEQDTSAVDPATTAPASAADQSLSLQSLFADGDLSGLRTRWNDVQASFVDDPRECVHKADGLVSDVVEQLTAGFSQARSRLEEQWGRGEQASTEDLRIALKGYREFFQRLLAV